MIEPVMATGAGSASGMAGDLWSGAQGGGANGDVDQALAHRFEEMLAAGPADAQVHFAQAVPSAQEVGVTNAIQEGWVQPLPGPAEAIPMPSFTEIIADQMQSVRQDWNHLQSEFANMRLNDDISLEQIIPLTMEMTHVNVTMNLMMQEISSFSSAMQQLMKAQ